MRETLWKGLYAVWEALARLLSRRLDVLHLGKVLFVSPHPDDETIGGAALLSSLAAAGLKPQIVVMTDGAASHPGHPRMAPAQVALQRQDEMQAAARVMGIGPGSLHFLGAADAGLARMSAEDRQTLAGRLSALVDRLAPDTVLLPYRADATSDHESCHAISLAALGGCRQQPQVWEYPIWARWINRSRWQLLRHPLRRLPLGAETGTKQKAIACHASQFEPLPPWEAPIMSRRYTACAMRSAEYFLPGRPAAAARISGDNGGEWQVIEHSTLPAGLRAQWLHWHQSNPVFDSPYFHPRYAETLSEAGWPVDCAVLRQNGEVVGFLPLQRANGNAAMAGMPMSDFQGLVSAPGCRFDAGLLLSAAGAGRMRFDHWLPAGLDDTAVLRRATSPHMHIEGGMEAYRQRLPARRKEFLSDTNRRRRKAEKDLGALRLEWQVSDADAPEVLARMMEWKRDQYRRTGAPDFFAEARHREYFRRLMGQRGNADFEGVLSALWCGSELLAVHAGMRAGGVVHWWFPAYSPARASYSPGRLLLAGYVDIASQNGLARIDLGKGDESYKRLMMTGATVVSEGVFDRQPLRQRATRLAAEGRDAVRGSSAFALLRQWRDRLKMKAASYTLLPWLPLHELPI